MEKSRCFWANGNERMSQYHDEEWGRPSHDDNYLFEMLIMEGMQAGLSWDIVLKKREAMRTAFYGFSIDKLAMLTSEEVDKMMQNESIIRHRLKLEGLRKNALAFQQIQKEFGSFANYLWGFTNHEVIMNHYRKGDIFPTSTTLSDQISKDLKKRGFTFVGTTIIYSYLQAVGVVNDHEDNCSWK